MKPKKQDYDIIVIGAGPAGSGAAILLADEGHDVLLLEKEKFPRYHIGESLMPETYWSFKKLGVLEKLRQSGYVKKHSVQFTTPTGKTSRPYYFKEHCDDESAVTWQVTRSKFDEMLFEHARERGVETLDRTAVVDILMEGDRAVGVKIKGAQIRAKVIVDASGLNALLAGKFGLKQPDSRLRKATIFTYFKNARRDSGMDEGATLIISTKNRDGWFWVIPLEDDITSIGIVSTPDYLFKNRPDRKKTFHVEVENCERMAERLVEAEQTGTYHVTSDFSFRTKKAAGPGWVLLGDAFGFLDPVYSSGVYLALKSAEMAAPVIHEAFEKSDWSENQLAKFAAPLSAAMDTIRNLVYAFYEKGFSFGSFLREHPEFKRNLGDLLRGALFKPGVGDIFDEMKKHMDLPDLKEGASV